MITLYDLAAKDPIKCWSPNPWKARYILNYKKLPYRTIYVDFEDVDQVIKDAGIPPSQHGRDGTPWYTVPSIIDDATGARVSESYKIAEYLDSQYPDTPKALPAGTEALQAAFYSQWDSRIWDLALVPIMIPSVPNILSKETSLEYFHSSRSAAFRKPLSEVRPVGEEFDKLWGRLSAFLNELEGWYAKSSGKFLVGDAPSFGDFTVGGLFKALKIVRGEDSEDWRKLSTMNNGRWANLLGDLERYASDKD
ncbi:hypothetical protein NP233_g10576 [Leucocoprinus birnbaumii]|uniref:GST N-terminal domain-containing protein n=1 Tax=Leucocoprinus birnbaumii TaxID=56174 RepID=A0AAD5VI12_9AGAR|nr:hypothetical protein NP233_g10576 [Leucocoprinus birnbaumii]